MIVIRVYIINVYLSLVFSVTLELCRFKLVIYLFVLSIGILRLLKDFHYKIRVYDKVKNFGEVW